VAADEKTPLGKVQSIKAHASWLLRKNGHEVKRIVRVHSPGDEGSYDGHVTVEYVDDESQLRTALLWSEKKRVKAGVEIEAEQIRVFNGWQGTKSWESE
jgi:hypothetical protein